MSTARRRCGRPDDGPDPVLVFGRARSTWRQYERQIEKYIRDHAGPSASIHYDVRRPGIFSGESRQIDIWVEDIFAGFVKDGTAAVDCKYFSKRVDVRGVEQFIGLTRMWVPTSA